MAQPTSMTNMTEMSSKAFIRCAASCTGNPQRDVEEDSQGEEKICKECQNQTSRENISSEFPMLFLHLSNLFYNFFPKPTNKSFLVNS